MRRLRSLLFWQAQFDARRPLIWLAGAVHLLIAGPILFWILYQANRIGWRFVTGSAYLSGLTTVHALQAVAVAAYRGTRTADDRANGILALIEISDTRPLVWTTFRFLSAMVSYLPLWALRLPLYTWCFQLGGITSGDLLLAEAVVATVFLLAVTTSMWVSLVSRSTQSALMLTGGIVIGGQAAFFVPRYLLQSLSFVLGGLPAGLQSAYEAALVFSQWSLIPQLWQRSALAGGWGDAGWAISLHLAVGGLFFMLAWKLAFIGEPAERGPRGRSVRRPPRRVWDDALAWQVYYIHSGGIRGMRRKIVIYLLITSVAIGVSLASPTFTLAMATIVAISTLIGAASPVGEAIMKETQEQTLSTLALLPLEPMEIYRGWRRGAWRYSLIDYCFAAAAIPVGLLAAGKGQPAFLGLMLVLFLSPAFFFLNGIVRFEWAVLWLALRVFPAMFATLVGSVAIAFEAKRPWIAFALFAACSVAIHRYILWQIPRQFLRQVERSA